MANLSFGYAHGVVPGIHFDEVIPLAMTRQFSKPPYSFFVLLWLYGIRLPVPVLAIPPVVPLLHASLHLSEADIGWLSSVPPMLLAIAAVSGGVLPSKTVQS